MPGAEHDVSIASGLTWSPDGSRLLFVGFAQGGAGPLYAFVSIAADGPPDPVVLSPWTDDLYWANERGVTWQAVDRSSGT